MSRTPALLLGFMAALPTYGAGVGAGAAGSSPVTVTNTASNSTAGAIDTAADTLGEAAKIAKDAVSVESNEVGAGGVTVSRKETLPAAAASRLGGLLRSKETAPGGAQVVRERSLGNLADSARQAVSPPFTNTRQDGRTTITEKSYLPFSTNTGNLFSRTQTTAGGVTTTTTPLGQVQGLRKAFYTHKKLPGGAESYGPPDILPDSSIFHPITKVTERLPSGGTVTRDRAFVSALKNPSSIGFTTSSTDEKGVTVQKFHSLVPNAPVHVDWNKVRGSVGDSDAAYAAQVAPKNPDGSVIAVDPAYKAPFQKAEQIALNNPAANTAKKEATSAWGALNPLGWAKSAATTTKGLFSQAAGNVPAVPNVSTGGRFQNSLRANQGNVIRPGGVHP